MQSLTRLMDELVVALKNKSEAEAKVESLAGEIRMLPHGTLERAGAVIPGRPELRADEPHDEEAALRTIELGAKLQEIAHRRREAADMLQNVVNSLHDVAMLDPQHQSPREREVIEDYKARISAERNSFVAIQQRKRDLILSLERRLQLLDNLSTTLQ